MPLLHSLPTRVPGARLIRLYFGAALILTLLPGPALAQAVPQPPSTVEAQSAEAARQRTSRLDALFASLGNARDDAEAAEFVAEIWRVWSLSGRPDVDALMARAGGGMQSRDFGLASLLLDEVVDIAPDFAEGWNRRATLRFMMSDHPQSLADIEKVLALEPRHFGALAGRAMIHIAAERWKPALEAYRAALAVNPFLLERHRIVPELERKVEGRPL